MGSSAACRAGWSSIISRRSFTRADSYASPIARVFLEYAQYRGFVVDPAVPRHSTGKPKVERGTPDLFLLRDFDLRKLTAQQSSDFYDVLVELITSNRAVDDGWPSSTIPSSPTARWTASLTAPG